MKLPQRAEQEQPCRKGEEEVPPPALTVTAIETPVVLHDRHPAQHLGGPPVDVAQNHVKEVWRAEGHRQQHLGLTTCIHREKGGK